MLRGDGARFGGMTTGATTSFRGDAQVAGINELYVFGGFLQPFRIGAFRNRGAILEQGLARLDVGLFFCRFVFGRIGRRAACNAD